MAMLRPKGKPQKIAEAVMKGKGIKVPKGGERMNKVKLTGPYLQHQENMDKQIRKIEKKVKGTEKNLKSLEKMDKKRDPACKRGMKMKKKK